MDHWWGSKPKNADMVHMVTSVTTVFCFDQILKSVYANYIGPSVMTDANFEGFPICDERISENDQCVIKIIGIHCEMLNYKQTKPFSL